VLRFLHCHQNTLILKWNTAMDSNCHVADLYDKYRLYFDLLHPKMSQYKVLPCNSYNMDEKGFIIGVIRRSKRVFSKQACEAKGVQAAL
jgi:hypothetical protein